MACCAFFRVCGQRQGGAPAARPLQGANAAEALWLVLVLTALLVAARAAFVVPFSILHNMMSGSEQRLSARDIVVVWWAGLMRGAVSVALVYFYFDDNPRQVGARASWRPLVMRQRPGRVLQHSSASSASSRHTG